MEPKIVLQEHWNKAYSSKPVEKMGWYENDVSATMKLIENTKLPLDASILNVGAGSTTLIDELLVREFSNIAASDVSEVSLENLKDRLGKSAQLVKWIVDDLTNSTQLKLLTPIDLWVDRAVLHFFVDETDRVHYFELLKRLVKPCGFALFAEFSLKGANRCSGLPVLRYSNEMLFNQLGESFQLVETFDYIYTMPSGDERPYIYSLFQRLD
jgi:SAM-dependent methyltransferase